MLRTLVLLTVTLMASAFIPYQDLEVNTRNTPLNPIARAARTAICRVRQIAPFLFDYREGPLPDRVADFASGRQFWDNLCTDDPLPETNTDIAFRGGQCNQLYNIAGNLRRSNGVIQSFGIVNMQGPLSRIWWTLELNPEGTFRTYKLNVADVDGFVRTQTIGSEIVEERQVVDKWIQIFPETPECGDNVPPPVLPPTPPANQYTINNININGQVGPITVSLPDLNVDLWPEFSFNPRIDMGGFTFEFQLAGIDITFPEGVTIPGTSSGTNLQPVLNRIDESTLAVRTDISEVLSELDELDESINQQFAALESLIRCCCCEEGVTYESTTVSTNSSGGRFPLPANTVAVRIIASNVDVNRVRTQVGSGNAPDVYFWGWYSIAYGDGDGGDRIPLSFLSTAALVGAGAEFIAVNPYFGAECTVIAIVKNKDCSSGGSNP